MIKLWWPKSSLVIKILSVILVLFLIAVFFVPTHGYTDKARTSEIILLTSGTRVEVEDFINSNPAGTPVDLGAFKAPITVGRYNDMRTTDGHPVFIEHYEVDKFGVIKVITSGLALYIEFTPIVVGEKVKEWHCYGRPHKLMPTTCRTEKLITNKGSR